MKRIKIILIMLLVFKLAVNSQTNTFSPYSRFGLGELNQQTFAHNQGMGGAFIALKPDSMFPIMLNIGNPASYSLIKFATFEVGGNFTQTKFNSLSTNVIKRNTNFNYAALGFPVRKKSGACFGIMPYSNVGYDLKSTVNENSIGDVTYNYIGEGGINKVFLGFGTMPFKESLIKYRKRSAYAAHDSTYKPNLTKNKLGELVHELLSDLSVGVNANYLFGSLKNYADIRYPNSSQYYNSIRERYVRINDFTGNFGLQTAFTVDSVRFHKKDTLGTSISGKRILKEKIKVTFGYFMALNNSVNAKYDVIAFNYLLTGSGYVSPKDTVIKSYDQKGKITLPLEQGIGIGIKKGERLNFVIDYAITDWSKFKMFEYTNTLKNNSRYSVGAQFVPDKFATSKGTFLKRTQYRAGLFYNTGYLDLKNTMISSYGITAGLSLPVGIRTGTGLVNISAQYGQTGSTTNNLIKENFWRINFGFTFNSTYFEDLWFRKFKYD